MKLKPKSKYIYSKVEWIFECSPETEHSFNDEYLFYINGPFCSQCHHEMDFKLDDKKNGFLICKNVHCKNKVKTDFHILSILKKCAHDEYHAKGRGLMETISLDLPPTKIKTRDEDENYFVATELTQKEGRKLAVIYVGERKDKQDKKDYSQIFIDLDQKQVRFDNTNKFPGDILTSIICEFNDNKTEINFKKKK